MQLLKHPDSCYRALQARDRRFDGKLFVGVASTGIYCRPVCPARTPRADRCRFYATSREAEAAGFRPCLRCRPQLAPGLAPVDREWSWIRSSLKALLAGEELPSSVGDRQLRLLFQRHLGLSPGNIQQYIRLERARVLLTQGSLSITEVAYEAGFSSLRRFQAVWKAHYGSPPSHPPARLPELDLELAYEPPFAAQHWLSFLKFRAIPGVEVVENGQYQRHLQVGSHRGKMVLTPGPTAARLSLSASLLPVLPELIDRARHLLDAEAPVAEIARHLGSLYHPGLRVPGAVDLFELAVRAVLGQQVSVAAARTLAGRLVDRTAEPGGGRYFPRASQLLALPAGEWGIPQRRVDCLLNLARLAQEGWFERAPSDWQGTERRLLAIPGLGPWTVGYISMRGLHNPDAFPVADLVLRQRTGLKGSELDQLSWKWSPWRAYAALSIWNGGESDVV